MFYFIIIIGLIVGVIAGILEECKKKEKLEKERLEQERLEQERLEQERLEQERLEKIKIKKFIINNSLAVKKIKEINNNYKFYDVKVYTFNIECESRREFSNFDIKKTTKDSLRKSPTLFDDAFLKANENIRSYLNYQAEFDKCVFLMYRKEDSAIKDFNFELLNSLEKQICEKLKLPKPCCTKTITYNIEYTTPAGLNSYSRKEYLSDTQIEKLKKEIIEENELEKQIKKEDLQLKLLKEEREKLQKDKEEFLKLTKGHIFSTLQPNENSDTLPTDQNVLGKSNLEILNEKFVNGEIDFLEYQEERNKIL